MLDSVAFVRDLRDIKDRKSCFNVVSVLESIEKQEIDEANEKIEDEQLRIVNYEATIDYFRGFGLNAGRAAKLVKYRRSKNAKKSDGFCINGNIVVWRHYPSGS